MAAFFLLHAACCLAEEGWAARGWPPLPRPLATLLVMAVLAGSSFWLFFPPICREGGEEMLLEEWAAVAAFFQDAGRKLLRFAILKRKGTSDKSSNFIKAENKWYISEDGQNEMDATASVEDAKTGEGAEAGSGLPGPEENYTTYGKREESGLQSHCRTRPRSNNLPLPVEATTAYHHEKEDTEARVGFLQEENLGKMLQMDVTGENKSKIQAKDHLYKLLLTESLFTLKKFQLTQIEKFILGIE
uniref:DUF4220 domain-containing protein n=1 Tax=Oryza brachyantha TaxID=4533 RepID=J3LWA9_ORYBR